MRLHEVVHEPAPVVGVAANRDIMGFALSLFITGGLLVGQGILASGIACDIIDWFNF